MSNSVVFVDNLTVRFGSTTALDGLTLDAKAGQITALLGPNGAGKTTLLRCATTLVKPEAGHVELLGHNVTRDGFEPVAARIGLMPQSAGAWSGIKAGELLDYMSKLWANPQSVSDLIELLGMGPWLETPYRRLSGGQQQTLNLAAALIGRPELVFLDEPTAGMDPHSRRKTWSVIKQLREAGVSVLLTTHAMDEAADLADQVFIVDAGKVAIAGSVAELTAEHSLEDVFLAHTTDPTQVK